MWTCVLKGLQFETAPEYGRAYLVAFLVESLESQYKNCSASSRIIFVTMQMMHHIIQELKKAFESLNGSKNRIFTEQFSLMDTFDMCLRQANAETKKLDKHAKFLGMRKPFNS